MRSSLIVVVAQGFGIGRIPVAPGTFGSLLGLAWTALLLAPQSLWLYVGGTAIGLAVSVWLCGQAEKVLGQTDPPSVVLDEIAALPVCFAAYVAVTGLPPIPGHFLNARNAAVACAVFAAFRLFDIAKPWPVRSSQRLPGGWGVTADDVLAALYVNASFLACGWLAGLLGT